MIVGAGDVAQRVVRGHAGRSASAPKLRWLALARSEARARDLRSLGILALPGDLDAKPSLKRAQALARSAWAVLYLAPPPNEGQDDPRIKHWLAMRVAPRARGSLAGRRFRPRPARKSRPLVYVSTTGVYGDCAGEWIDETRPVRPQTARAQRRVAAERRLRRSARYTRPVILRAPGIYALERLPLERLRAGTPVLSREQDVYTNHIHADDLARAVWLAVFRGRNCRAYNIVDAAQMKMGEYFDAVAEAFGLPKPPRRSRLEIAREISPMLMSFMNESRRIGHRRMIEELRLRLRYPTPLALLKPAAAAASQATSPTQQSLW